MCAKYRLINVHKTNFLSSRTGQAKPIYEPKCRYFVQFHILSLRKYIIWSLSTYHIWLNWGNLYLQWPRVQTWHSAPISCHSMLELFSKHIHSSKRFNLHIFSDTFGLKGRLYCGKMGTVTFEQLFYILFLSGCLVGLACCSQKRHFTWACPRGDRKFGRVSQGTGNLGEEML